MDQLQKRVADRMSIEARDLRADQTAQAKRRQGLVKDSTAAAAVIAKAMEQMADGAKLNKAATGKLDAALKTQTAAARELPKVNAKMAANAAALTNLESPGELARRVKSAKDLGVTDTTVTGVEAAKMVLIRRGKPTHITDLTAEVLEAGVVKLQGKTPSQTMSAYMNREASKPNGEFVRVAPGVFWLRQPEAAEPVPAA